MGHDQYEAEGGSENVGEDENMQHVGMEHIVPVTPQATL